VWDAQAITYSYERARGLREVGQRADGYTITASKTITAPVDVVFDAFVDPERRAMWLADHELSERTATRPRSARFDWEDGVSRIHVIVVPKGPDRSTVSLEQARLADGTEADKRKSFWRERLATLKELLETGHAGAGVEVDA
jgi:hypothetical protein